MPGRLSRSRQPPRHRQEGFLASVCHDVQQPLTVILAQTQLLQRQLARGGMLASGATRDEPGVHLCGGDTDARHDAGPA